MTESNNKNIKKTNIIKKFNNLKDLEILVKIIIELKKQIKSLQDLN